MPRPGFILALTLTTAFAIATTLQPETRSWRTRSNEGGLMGMLLGDGRQMFANQFTAKADQYFHSGYYPSIFDQRAEKQPATDPNHVHDEHCDHDHEAEVSGHVHDDACGHAHDPHGACAEGCKHSSHEGHSVEECESKTGGWDTAKDWIAKFGRNFRVTEHTHLEGAARKELLPWLRISAELDPHQINTYLVGSYWLRKTQKSAEAEKFIREGLEANNQNCELLAELGQIYLVDRTNTVRAARLFELALQKWDEQEQPKENPNLILLSSLASNLARLEEAQGNLQAAIQYLERARSASPQSEVLARQIEELKIQMRSNSPANPPAPR